MDIRFSLLSYKAKHAAEESDASWMWEGAPVFTKEHQIKIWFNGHSVKFNSKTGEFGVHVGSVHDIRFGILEISILEKGVFVNELIGYCFRTIEDILYKRKGEIHYVKILPANDPITGWLCCRECRKPGFRPDKTAFFIALRTAVQKTSWFVQPPNYTLKVAKLLADEQIADRLADLQEIFYFLFRDIRNFSELIYGGKELISYYSHVNKKEFAKIPPGQKTESHDLLQNIKEAMQRRKSKTEKRVEYAEFLKQVLPSHPYLWHVESKAFYLSHLLYYRYAISSYGHSFLRIHGMLNIVQNKLKKCVCRHCQEKTTGAENRFFHMFTGVPYEDILHDDSSYLEHVLFLERETKTLIITFKGTLNRREALIDTDYKYHRYKGNLYHKGIFEESQKFAVKYEQIVLEKLKKHGLENVKLLGQSLGGALATLVCVFFKEAPALQGYNISSIAYSPPPVVNNPTAFRKYESEEQNKSITTVIYGDDIIPTLCVGKIFELRLIAMHLYTISVGRFKNKTKYIQSLLKKMKKRGMLKLALPGTVYRIRHIKTSPGTYLVRKSHWSEYSAVKLTSKGFIHHAPGVMINALKKSLLYFYNTEVE